MRRLPGSERPGGMYLELGHSSVLLTVGLLKRDLLVEGAHHVGHAELTTLGHSGDQVGHEVDAATLSTGSSKYRGDGVLQTKVGIGDDQFQAVETSGVQRA